MRLPQLSKTKPNTKFNTKFETMNKLKISQFLKEGKIRINAKPIFKLNFET
jgi:hypothetical protein